MRQQERIVAFQRAVWKHYRADGRHDLPWRQPTLKLRYGKQDFDPYKILVSEVMLQQTQVPRVLEKYKEFLRAFPTVHALARAPLADVLRVWSGMGYNRRAKYLREAAKVIVGEYGGRVPKDAATLRTIPGIGPYTASAVLIFAFNTPDTMIETNIRAAFIYHFASGKAGSTLRGLGGAERLINDRDLLPLITKAAEGQDPREWHWALMDYGSHLKKIHGNPARKSAHHVRQSKFEGSIRQVRGAILRELHKGPSFVKGLPFEKAKVQSALAGLARDGLVKKEKGKWRIS
ncbi:A/G-specific adenine glycosylase [Candidatus Kaiserbacteria bacterium]|nr:A/G-specific adenine glycosylase [Candidatus Kaiserbacteria bacterium]